jgi:hypothetical protein
MLRMQSESGWWLITHPDHARLAGAFAEAWGNEQFRSPEPRPRVLLGIASHDDGWADRDAHPSITREGKPSAFSSELVGKYSAFEEIDLADYLGVRERAVRSIGSMDAYAGLLVALHTNDLLTARADRSTIKPEELPMLDAFLYLLREYRYKLIGRIQGEPWLAAELKSPQMIREHFRLLQACDNLSLLACVDYASPANLLHPLPLHGGGKAEIQVFPIASRHFRLDPWPFAEAELTFSFPARHVAGHRFNSSAELEDAFHAAPVETRQVRLSA